MEQVALSSAEAAGSVAVTRTAKVESLEKILKDKTDEKTYEEEVHKELCALAETQGNSFVEDLLRRDIASVKRMGSIETKLAKKKVEKQRELAITEADIKKLKLMAERVQSQIDLLKNAIKARREGPGAPFDKLDDARRHVSETVDSKLPQMMQEADERNAEAEAWEAEAEELQRQIDVAHDFHCGTFPGLLKDTEMCFTKIQSLLKASTVEAGELQLTMTRTAEVRNERLGLVGSLASMRGQLVAYDENYKNLQENGFQPEQAMKMMNETKAKLKARIAQLRKQKSQADSHRQRFDKEMAEVRAREAEALRQVENLQNEKVAAEKRCREAQEKYHAAK